MYLMHLSRKRM